MNRYIVATDDGSHTLKVDEMQEHYHSTFGAINESMHVYINAGLYHVLQSKPHDLAILEVGFGTGLNTLLTLLDEKISHISVNYTAVEAYPLEKEWWTKLNYTEMLDKTDAATLFHEIHACAWNKTIAIRPGFILEKIHCKLEDFTAKKKFDLVYFDAFGPDVQPELWTEEVFKKIAGMTAKEGVLVTYSCKGRVKRALRSAGFEIEKLPGPEGKREMIRGILKSVP